MSSAADEREQLLRVLHRIWLETPPGSALRRSRRLAASGWLRHLRHRTRPGAVAEEPARDPASRVLVGALDLDALGDALIAEHEARLALHGQALALAAAAAEGAAAPERIAAALDHAATLRAVARVALRLLRELGPEVADWRREELVRRLLSEGPPEPPEEGSS
jgi:hypothetical protein